jgi:hypothetical protein
MIKKTLREMRFAIIALLESAIFQTQIYGKFCLECWLAGYDITLQIIDIPLYKYLDQTAAANILRRTL